MKEKELIEKFEKLDFMPVIKDASTTEENHNNLLVIYEITKSIDQKKINSEKIDELIDNLIKILFEKNKQ
eukprot:jgi/Orpsp1_1/1186743/evm.model.d7180000052978.1